MFDFTKVAMLFVLTAVAEIVGCYLPWLVLKHRAIALKCHLFSLEPSLA